MKVVKKTHVGSYGVIIDNNKIVLIKKAIGGYKGKLDLPGGGIEHGELPQEALKRELMEEVGVEVIDYKLLDVTATNVLWKMSQELKEDLHHIGILYNVKVSGEIKRVPDGIDSNGSEWYEIRKLKKENLTPFAYYSLILLGYKLGD